MYLTASSIKDYLDCPQKLEYRLHGESSTPNAYFLRGTVVHEIIADRSIDNPTKAKEVFFEEFSRLVVENDPEFPFRTTFTSMVKESNKMLDNYYLKIDPAFDAPLPEHIEMFFEVTIGGQVFKGVIDQIREDSVFDWKTTVKPLDPVTRNADYQFTLYGLAYKELFGKYPKNIYYGHLYSGEVHKLERTEADYEYLKEVANQVDFSMKNDIFPRNYSKYGCALCQYKHLCFDEDDKIRY